MKAFLAALVTIAAITAAAPLVLNALFGPGGTQPTSSSVRLD